MTNTDSGRQVLLTVAMGKRLLGDALAADPAILEAAKHHCLVVILGSTNAQVATSIAAALSLPFSPKGFHRGLQRGNEQVSNPTPPQTADFIVKEGQRLEGKTIFDVVDTLGPDDIILKGANAIHLESRTAGILIASPVGGTIIPITSVAVGLARLANRSGQKGLRLMESCGDIYTELDAVRDLFSVRATLLAAGGVLGAEGSVLLQLSGNEENLCKAETYFRSIQDTPSFSL